MIEFLTWRTIFPYVITYIEFVMPYSQPIEINEQKSERKTAIIHNNTVYTIKHIFNL